ncbi:MAG: acyltransferase [Bacteroidia bacterium]|nr:acyltransferase [Bacteroidia bacterium]
MFTKFCVWYFKRNGWQITGDRFADKKYLVVVGPHTSAWDFIISVAVRTILKEDIKYLAKKELFKFPFKNFFLKMGGYPVDRSKKMKLVDQVIEIFNSKEEFAIAVTPEGTRKRVNKWKTGFYNIAKGAKIPIYLGGIDYDRKLIVLKGPITPSDDLEADIRSFVNFFKDLKGKNPEMGIFEDTGI